MQVFRLAEESDEEQLGGCVAVETSCDEEIRYGNTVRRFGPFGRQTGESRGRDVRTDVDVNDDGEKNIEAGSEDLERIGCAHGVLRIAHLGDEDEEHEVAGVSEHRIGNADESGDKTR